MELCHSCQQFNLHDFIDGTYSYSLSTVDEGARQRCAFCSLLSQQLQLETSLSVPRSQCWIRMMIPTQPRLSASNHAGLGLSEVEIYLTNSALEKKTQRKSRSVFFGLAADPGR